MSFFTSLFNRPSPSPSPRPDDYRTVIDETVRMASNRRAQNLAGKHGLSVMTLTWEDTARFKGSCVGPNISDMTIQVQHEGRVSCMPVIRHPNFTDHTADVAIDDISVPVGNEKGKALERIPLSSYLRNLREHLSDPSSLPLEVGSLLAPREHEVLVSAQACFLPIPSKGDARFNPVVFNYQSRAGAPAVLTILVTRQGTSATIIDNQRDAFASASGMWGQRLFHNANGERASLTGTRIADFVESGGDGLDAPKTVEEAKKAGLNHVLMIQVPLKQAAPAFGVMDIECAGSGMAVPCAAPLRRSRSVWGSAPSSDVEEAVIGHGPVEGPFTEIDGVAIERDPRFPIRVTVQFYKATSNGVVDATDLAEIKANLDAVYADARASGSLVVGNAPVRSTDWDDQGRGKAEPKFWWADFWAKQEAETGRTRTQLLRELEALLGRRPADDELEAAIRRVFGGAPGL